METTFNKQRTLYLGLITAALALITILAEASEIVDLIVR